MKSIAGMLLLVVCISPAFAEKITVDSSDLDAQTLKRVMNKTPSAQDEARGWVGIGKEIGEAVNASLGAVVGQAENFGKTSVGRFTMFLVAWKIVGASILHVIGGIGLWLFSTVVMMWSYRRTCLPIRYVKSDIVAPDKTRTRTYEIFDQASNYRDINIGGQRFLHGLIWVIFTVISLVVAFSW